jgi:hypothetical protein
LAKDYVKYEGDINIIMSQISADGRELASMSEVVKLMKKEDILLHVITSTGYNYQTETIEDFTHEQILDAIAGNLKIKLSIVGSVDIGNNSSCYPHAYTGTSVAIAYGSKNG